MNFKDKMKNKKTIGQREINSNDAIGLSFNEEKTNKLVNVKISALTQNPYQPRQSMDEEQLKSLSDSISENGLLQAIVITPINNDPQHFYIVAGHRRVEASKALNKETISAVIVQMNDDELRVNALVENIQRENLTSLEEAFAISTIVKTGVSQTDLAKKLGKSKSVLSTYIKISNLDNDLVSYLKDNNLDIGRTILYEISNVPQENQLKALKYITNKSMNREQIREYIKSLNGDVKKVSPAKLFNAFEFSHKNNKVSFKLDIEKLENKKEVIDTLEKLLLELYDE